MPLLPSRLLRLLPPLLVFLSSTSALNFTIQSINCTQLDWSLTLSQPEWSVSSYIDLFLVSTTGGQNYSVLYSAFQGGDFPGPGSYSMVTNFGDTRLSGGGYRIGVGLADGNGNLLTTTSGGGLVQQVTSVDGRVFSADCGASGTSSGAAAGLTSTASSSAVQTSTAMSAVTSTSSTRPASTSSASTSAAAATATNLASSATTSSTNLSSSSGGHGINKAALAAGLVGGSLLLLLAFFIVRFCTSRRRTRAAAHRLSSLRPLELCEKQPSGFLSPRATDERAVSRDTLDAAAIGRLSESSRPYGAYSARSGSLNNVLSDFPQNPAAPHDWVMPPTLSRKPTPNDPIPTYPSSQRSNPAPLVINLPSPTISPLTSPTRSVRPSPSTSHFRIPRVSVPSYSGDVGQLSRSNSGRRLSTGGMTSISMDREEGEADDPFVDAAQEPQVHG